MFWVGDDRPVAARMSWRGTATTRPYKYDLRRFSPVGPLLFDHADPSIFTVLTAPSETPGTANVDFVCFPDRWAVAEDTFRPALVSHELHERVHGPYLRPVRRKAAGCLESGASSPGGFSLHNAMLPHGPDAEAFGAASSAALAPTQARRARWRSCSKAATASSVTRLRRRTLRQLQDGLPGLLGRACSKTVRPHEPARRIPGMIDHTHDPSAAKLGSRARTAIRTSRSRTCRSACISATSPARPAAGSRSAT